MRSIPGSVAELLRHSSSANRLRISVRNDTVTSNLVVGRSAATRKSRNQVAGCLVRNDTVASNLVATSPRQPKNHATRLLDPESATTQLPANWLLDLKARVATVAQTCRPFPIA